MELHLKGRVALITGPAKGMGAAVTRAFASEGCRLALLGRDVAAIEPVAAEVRAQGIEAIVLPCDITDGAACDAAVAATQKAFGGRIDILVNVAGGSGPIGKTGWETTEEEFDEIIDLNMRGCFNTMKACLPTMIAQRDGKIVNVGGTFGMRGRAGRLAYSASKWGLRGLTKSFALEAGPFGINVNCVAPGMVDGPRFPRQGRAGDGEAPRHHRGAGGREARRRLCPAPRLDRRGCGQRLPVPRLLRLAPDHRRRPSGRRRLGLPVSAAMVQAGNQADFVADLVLSGGTIVTGQTRYRADVAIKDGLIALVGAPEAMPAARETVDVSGKFLLPGAIDVHVHFREPGYTHKEDWATGTAAAAMGGTTTVFEMPNTHPPTRSVVELRQKQAAAAKAHVDYGLYGLLAEDNIDELPGLIAGGVNAFKCFMGNTFGNLPSPSTGAMLEGFEIIAPSGLRISLHAETASIMAWRQQRLMAAGRNDPLAHIAARPAIVAAEAVSRAAELAEWTGARVHVLHISSAAELRPLADAKARGVEITGETCPCYLLLDTRDYARLGSIIRVNPPVREASDSEAIWRALQSGVVDMIATDHAPHTPEEKIKDVIWQADCGFPGVETQMPLMLNEVSKGRITLEHYVRISAENPARSFGLWPAKGRIEPGAEADIAVVDMERRETIRAAALHSRAKITPFEGVEVTGVPIHTLVRGRFVQRDRRLVDGTSGWGRQVTAIQKMPPPNVRNADQTLAACIAAKPQPVEAAA